MVWAVNAGPVCDKLMLAQAFIPENHIGSLCVDICVVCVSLKLLVLL